ncbi:hypothetical protein A9Q98_15320 [Thalassotalea sp. 42_200_T64]|nr:hypothetical protein A9Q98_15320 [Thalassotalea sp. 42_200_T64]
MKQIKKYLAIFSAFILLYLVFLVNLAPANKLLSRVDLPTGVSLHGISGSIFSGKAQTLTINQLSIENVNWSVSYFSLITLNPKVTVNIGNNLASISGRLELSNLTSGLTVSNADIKVDANEVIGQLNLPIDINAAGQIHLTMAEFAMGKPICAVAQGAISWPNASVNAMEENVELGTLKALLSCEKGSLNITIDPKNDLGLELTAYVVSKSRIKANGYLTPGDKFPENLKPVLGFIGNKDRQGRYKISL